MTDSACLPHATLAEEAARYALIRRLAPTLRHHMAGEFQPIGMLAVLLERRLQQPQPDAASLKDNCAAIGNLSRHAAQTCAELMGWVAPRGLSHAPVAQAVGECVDLLSPSLRFRGFAVSNEVSPLPAHVPSQAVRSVLAAALLALSDEASEPADLTVQAEADATQVRLRVSLLPADRRADNRPEDEYRSLSWSDVQALAQAESVGLERSAHSVQITLAAVAA